MQSEFHVVPRKETNGQATIWGKNACLVEIFANTLKHCRLGWKGLKGGEQVYKNSHHCTKVLVAYIAMLEEESHRK